MRWLAWLAVVPAYALGTFPSAVMVARSKGIDITKVGSGNPGASNIARTMGNRWGVVVFALDGLKGALPALVGVMALGRNVAYGMVIAAVLGHMFPVTRRFQGGKGVATMAGAAFVLQPIVASALLVVWFVVRKLTGVASLASIAIIVGLPVGVALRGGPAWEVVAIIAVNGLVMLRHTGNIRRLLHGDELSASRRK